MVTTKGAIPQRRQREWCRQADKRLRGNVTATTMESPVRSDVKGLRETTQSFAGNRGRSDRLKEPEG